MRAAGALRLLTWPALDAAGADVAVTARSGGVSSGPYATLNLSLSVGDDPARVLENRHRLASALGADLGDFVFARQVHGAGVRVVGEADRGSGAFTPDNAIEDTDALVTRSPGVVLAILTADCVPIVLHDPVVGVLVCVHAGWRGTVARICAAAVAAMESLGSNPSDVIAGVGPAVDPARYQVGPDVHQAVTKSFGRAATAFIRPDPAAPDSAPSGPALPVRPDSGPAPPARPDSGPAPSCCLLPSRATAPADRWLLDLWAANQFVLREAGVPAAQIHITDLPTGPLDSPVPMSYKNSVSAVDPTDPASHGYFFSDRAARPCGRLALVARLRPDRKPMEVTT
jgi:polyphenol oxidase